MPCKHPVLTCSKLEVQRAQIVEEEKRKTMQFETEMRKRQAEY